MKSPKTTARNLLSWCGAVGTSLAGLQIALALFAVTVERVACKKEEEPPPETLPPDERPQFLGVDSALNSGAPSNDLEELYGGALPRDKDNRWVGCMNEWTDEAPIFSRARRHGGARNAVEIVFWKAVTYKGQTAVGKYVGDLYGWAEAGTGAAGFPSGGSSTANQRLLERLPRPAPAPPGYRAIMPGECVGASFEEGPDRVIGRFVIDLPAHRSVHIVVDTPMGLEVDLAGRLLFNGADVPNEYDRPGEHYAPEHGPGGLFDTTDSGLHTLVIHRTDKLGVVSPQQISGKIYTLRVYWGTVATSACDPDSARKYLCF